MKKIFLSALLAAAFLAAGNVWAQEAGGTRAAVTQATSVTTGVTVTGNSGVITTFTETAASGATVTFTVTNTAVLGPTSVILLSVNGYTGTGSPVVEAGAVAAGSFNVIIRNVHASAALNAPVKIGFAVQ